MKRVNTEPYVLSPEELRRLQLVLLEMLKEVDRICRKNDISYSIFAGTMLGAVRHKGFIPWDDDLDVAMLRTEYERFRDACIKDLDSDKFFFQDNTTDDEYPWGYARIRRKNSEFVRIGQEHLKMQTGIFLDIFPLDGVPNIGLFRAMHCFRCFFYRKVLYAGVGKINSKTLFMRGVYTVLNKIPRSFAFGRLDRMIKRWKPKDTKLVRMLTFPTPRGRTYGFARRWFVELDEIEFEGVVFPGNKDYDGFLSYYYGDYMTVPPKEKRWWHPVSRFKLPTDN